MKAQHANRPGANETFGPVFVLQPRLMGVGEDRIIGGPSGPSYSKIDLSKLTYPVEIHWVSQGCGSITDGADCIVFQGIEEIILPACMHKGRASRVGSVA